MDENKCYLDSILFNEFASSVKFYFCPKYSEGKIQFYIVDITKFY
jgi:hypothetical protein